MNVTRTIPTTGAIRLFGLAIAATLLFGCGDDEKASKEKAIDASTGDGPSDDDDDDDVNTADDDEPSDDDDAPAEGQDAGTVAEPTPEPDADPAVPPDAGSEPEGNFGDVGQPCDPALETDCASACLELSDGSGVCIDACGDSGDIDCPTDYKCNSLPVSGDVIDVCLPNASCGELDYQGACDGTTLQFCDTEGPVDVDCSEVTSASGEAMTCGFLDDEIGYNCVPEGFTGGCGDETPEGRCEGDVLTYCASQQSGEVVTVDCGATEQTCAVATDNVAGCAEPGTEGCGAVTFEGQCDGDVLTYCDASSVVVVDCSDTGVCRWQSDDIGYNCVAETVAGTTNGVVGAWVFEKPALTEDGLGAVSASPVRHGLVRVLREADNTEVVRGFTGADGSFDLNFDEASEVYVEVLALGDPSAHPVSVRDCPLQDCNGNGAVYAVRSAAFMPQPGTDLGSLTVTVAGNSGAFNIFDQFVRGADFAQVNFGKPPPSHIVQWKSGSDTACGTSCFSAQDKTVFVLSTQQDTDEFDDPVLMHEYGHFLESAFSRSDSPGGFHDGSPTDPRLAWGEGYGTYVGARIAGSSLYIDSQASGASVTDINRTGLDVAVADPSSARGITQLLSEYLVAEVLWHIDQGSPAGSAPEGSLGIFDVLGNYFPGDALADRGLQGVELVDFLDGWFCRGHGSRAVITEIVTESHGFPYDYPTLASCQ